MADRELIEKLTEIMKPLDNEIMMCDTNNDLLLLASCMMAVSMQIYKTQLGSKKVKIILQSAIDRIR